MQDQASAPRAFQFSLGSVFVVMTALATMLSIYFAVGRSIGMSTTDILSQGLPRLVFALPILVVWSIGLSMAVRRLRSHRRRATLATISLGGFMLTTFVSQLAQMSLMHLVTSNRLSASTVGWSFSIVGGAHTIFTTICWILVLMAIFTQRPPDTSAAETFEDVRR